MASDQSIESVAEQAVYMMPDALQYPESASVLIEIAGKNLSRPKISGKLTGA